MVERTIMLNTINSVTELNKKMLNFEEDIDAISERYVIDCKSVLGLFSLDLTKPLVIRLNSDDELLVTAFDEMIKPYLL